MITWMQKHKKWLVITIWISTIAFVGAGFVGWGSYNYGSKGGVVAVVGDKEVTMDEYNQEYSRLYSQYAQLFGNSFNNEVADQLKLKDVAFSQLLQKSLIIAYGKSLGLIVTKEEIAKELMLFEEFKTNGKFDKDVYIKVLNQNRMTPREFEASLESSLLFKKVQNFFSIEPTEKEIENLSRLLFLEDDISYKVLDSQSLSVEVVEEELKKFYEKNKESYKSEISYELAIKELALKSSNSTLQEQQEQYEKFKSDYKFEDGKIKTFEEAKNQVQIDLDESFTKKDALTLYLKLKKGEENFDKSVVYENSKLPFTSENIEKIKEAKKDDVIKPFFENGKFYIVKVVNINQSTILPYEDAKILAKDDFVKELKLKKLDELAEAELKDFKATNSIKVSRKNKSLLAGLNTDENGEFLNQFLFSTDKTNIIKVGSKAVIYKINSSKLAEFNKENSDLIKNEIKQIQESDLSSNLLKKLENSFTIKTSIQTKE